MQGAHCRIHAVARQPFLADLVEEPQSQRSRSKGDSEKEIFRETVGAKVSGRGQEAPRRLSGVCNTIVGDARARRAPHLGVVAMTATVARSRPRPVTTAVAARSRA